MTGVEPRREIEVLRGSSKIGIVLATLLMLALGALAFYGVFDQKDLDGGERVIGSLIGVMFGGFGVACVLKMRAMLGRHTLVFDHDGIAYETSRGGVPFRVSWTELKTASVSTATHDSRTNGTTLVRLDLTPSTRRPSPSVIPRWRDCRTGAAGGCRSARIDTTSPRWPRRCRTTPDLATAASGTRVRQPV